MTSLLRARLVRRHVLAFVTPGTAQGLHVYANEYLGGDRH